MRIGRLAFLDMDTELVTREIQDFFSRMGFGHEVENVDVHTGGANRFCVRVKNSFAPDDDQRARIPETNILIGERGSTLSAIEYLIKRIIYKKHNDAEFKFTLDINDYRVKRLEELKQDVKAAAKEVRLSGREVPLRPMTSFERRIVHLLLEEYPDITTSSVGMEPERRVLIKPYP